MFILPQIYCYFFVIFHFCVRKHLLWKQKNNQIFIIKIFIEIQKFKLLFVKKSTNKNIIVSLNVNIKD